MTLGEGITPLKTHESAGHPSIGPRKRQLVPFMNRSRLQSLLITRDETAEMLGVSGFTLWRWRKNGFLKPLVGAGGRTAAYLRSDVEKIKRTAYLDRLKPGRPTHSQKGHVIDQ